MNTNEHYQGIKSTYEQAFFTLLYQAHGVHRAHHDPLDVQKCALLSVKTGGCSEDCSYCAQSAHYDTPVDASPLMTVEDVTQKAQAARKLGAERFCMGAAWRGVNDGPGFDSILEMVRNVRELGMEACVTLGMLNDDQAVRLKEAGLTAYNHNLDTSREYYPRIVQTHTYDERINTIHSVQKAGISVCCGGILGMGEKVEDRLAMLAELKGFDPPPESIPINCLMPMPGTPLDGKMAVDAIEIVRTIATTRIHFPLSRIRLSAGREAMSRETQILSFFAGANSVFFGEKLLTAGNPSAESDDSLFQSLESLQVTD